MALVAAERNECHQVAALADGKKCAAGAIKFLDYMETTWMPLDMWKGWSKRGREDAAKQLGIHIEGVIPTTNHLESFNRNLKRKYVPQWQHSGHRLRFDVLLYHLITNILPHIYAQHRMLSRYTNWRAERFRRAAGGSVIAHRLLATASSATVRHEKYTDTPRAWYEPNASRDSAAQAIISAKQLTPIPSGRQYELWARCLSGSTGNHYYWLTVHASGAATCTCLDWLYRGGACKHLRAFRRFIEGWIHTKHLSSESYVFPSTAAEAEAIEVHNQRWYGEQYDRAVTLPTTRDSDGTQQNSSLGKEDCPAHLQFRVTKDLASTVLPPRNQASQAALVDLSHEAAIASGFASISGDPVIASAESDDDEQDDSQLGKVRTGIRA
ncbi:hypothetical protein PHLCEN_2v10232 [Hermanssonia centrifuga]|uniref:SWIM-type domain-containing protein n=1 Tax=Hermanssonia centrifuga TaxID=98765 RepID=A0A2R6NNI6_9APHY|nr:hypothetical protein PHLCEN_2v10232 [Hermanssonia centrifuga]